MTIENSKYHNRIAELRKEKGISQSKLAKDTGLTRQAISLYEIEKREPKLDIWIKLADYFGVSVSYLQGLTNFEETDVDDDRLVTLIHEGKNKADNYVYEMYKDKSLKDYFALASVLKKSFPADFQKDFTDLENDISNPRIFNSFYSLVMNEYWLFLRACRGNKEDIKYYNKLKNLIKDWTHKDDDKEN
ncbi:MULTISPECIES: helix-turn-helix domain-containing protein [Limosilactobacillus]|uniref:helix-turn-helix domain-containing protein n=1 Tax=Limosilactobacillus TaxID=2742598 RepID=UPI000318AD0D|nr:MULTISPECIES: helix-turn-helix transcriptional regulator [Limosilactobacillus]MCD7125351.1 helix-turn-helix transcriptional regulator [Limosilactobacillus caviae]